MEFRYELATEDYVAWARHLLGPKGTVKLSLTQRLAMPSAGVSWGLYVYSVRGHFTWLELGLISGAIAWGALLPRWLAFQVERAVRGVAKSSSSLVGHHELVVDETGVTQRTPVDELQRFWPGLRRIDETATHLFIFLGPKAAFIVPKSRLGDAAGAVRHAVEEGIRGAAQTATA